jgi:precorrin-6A/cobalt-precorrin-6A reductase
MKILLLGGTADGRKLASKLHQLKPVEVIYSVAGLVRLPQLDCQVISGGFSQLGGLDHYLKQQQISAILDVTHPYARQMSNKAAMSATLADIPYWRFHRPAWQPTAADTWLPFAQTEQLPQLLTSYQRVFFTIGQLTEDLVKQFELSRQQAESLQQAESFQPEQSHRHLVRTAAPSKVTLAESMLWLKGIGPFKLAEERALMTQYNIEVLVCKNSGGSSTYAKLEAARQLNIPVLMQTRPELPTADKIFMDADAVQQHILAYQQ